MLTTDELSRLTIVLVRARDPNNIGAVARAMHDFGFRDLRLVNEYRVPFERAKSAVDASAVLDAAREYPSVAEAVADCTLVVGTTAVGPRRQGHPLHTLAEASNRLRSELASPDRRLALPAAPHLPRSLREMWDHRISLRQLIPRNQRVSHASPLQNANSFRDMRFARSSK